MAEILPAVGEGADDCLRSGENCVPAFKENSEAYCGDSMDIISLSNWTMSFLWYLLAAIPQLLIILMSLAWTRLLSVTYLFHELI